MSNLTDPNLSESHDQSPASTVREPMKEAAAKSHEKGAHGKASTRPYAVSVMNTDKSLIPSEVIQKFLEQKGQTSSGQPTVIIYQTKDCTHPSDKVNGEEDVSEEFVTSFNEHIGNKENQEIAKRLLKKMETLGGLVPNTSHDHIDIPAARMGLAMLAGLKNHRLKMRALHDLQMILKNDPITKEMAIDLVHLTINLLKKMDRELLQAEIIDVQRELAKTYGAVAELLLHHYTKKHINAITKELKAQLSDSAIALEDLNRQEDPRLLHVVHFALEGINRLKDDSKPLLEILNRIYHFAYAAAQISNQNTDFTGAQVNLEAAFSDIRPYLKHSWYSAVVLLHELAKNTKTNRDSLLTMQSYIAQEHKGLNWRFLFEAIEILADIVINGHDHKIRQTAFEGMRGFHPPLPGAVFFDDFAKFKNKADISPVLYLKAPRKKNRNILIRTVCIENLIRIAKESPDKDIRMMAKEALIERLLNEKDGTIKEMIGHVIPKNLKQRQEWLDETTPKRLSDDSARIKKKSTSSVPESQPIKQSSTHPERKLDLSKVHISTVAKKVITPDPHNLKASQTTESPSSHSPIPSILLTPPPKHLAPRLRISTPPSSPPSSPPPSPAVTRPRSSSITPPRSPADTPPRSPADTPPASPSPFPSEKLDRSETDSRYGSETDSRS